MRKNVIGNQQFSLGGMHPAMPRSVTIPKISLFSNFQKR